MGAEGLENVVESKQKHPLKQKLTHTATQYSSDAANLERLIEAWPTLDDDTKAAIQKLIDKA